MNMLKSLLWDRWGTAEYPAEWDGQHYGGGRGSQRFWEYLWVIDQLSGHERHVIDVGAGPNLFLPKLLGEAFPRVEAVDPELRVRDARHHPCDLRGWVDRYPSEVSRVDCVTCVSVVEHVQDPGMIFTDLARFVNAKLIVTLELGFDPPGFEYQLTLRKLYAGLKCFESHYLSRMETCPVWADNSKGGYWKPFGMVLLPKSALAAK